MIFESELDCFGSPLDSSSKRIAKKAFDGPSTRDVLEHHRIEESKRNRLANLNFESMEDRLQIFDKMLESQERVRVVATRENETEGSIEFSVEIDAGDLSSLEKGIQAQAAKDDPEGINGELEDALYDIFGSGFQKQVDDAIWKSIRHDGRWNGAHLDFSKVPNKQGDFADAKFSGTLELRYSAPALEYGDLEKLISQAIDRVI